MLCWFAMQSEDSEEDDVCAISDRWAFQRESKTWSRLRPLSPDSSGDGVPLRPLRASASSESVLSDFSNLEVTSVASAASALSDSSLSVESTRETSPSEATPSTFGGSSVVTVGADGSQDADGEDDNKKQRASSSSAVRDKPKRCSRSFLRRMESLRRKGQEREAAATTKAMSTRMPPDGLQCTSDESLPGRKTKAGKAHTICRSSLSRCRLPEFAAGVPRRSCLYLEDYQLAWSRPQASDRTVSLRIRQQGGRLVHLPKDHKPGTFPRSLSIESLCPASLGDSNNAIGWPGEDCNFSVGSMSSRSDSQDFSNDDSTFRKRRNSTSSVGSVYDNVPEAAGSSEELLNLASTEQALDLDDILRQVHGLQHNIDQWSRQLDQSHTEEDSAVDSTVPSSPHLEEQSMSDVGTTMSDYDSTGNSLNDGDGEGEMRERRDSGVGASLTRPSR